MPLDLTPPAVPPLLRVADFPLGSGAVLPQTADWETITLRNLGVAGVEVSMNMRPTRYEPDATGGPGLVAGPGYAAPKLVTKATTNACAVVPGQQGRPCYRLVRDLQPAEGTRPEVPGAAVEVATGTVYPFDPGQDWLGWLATRPEDLRLQNHYMADMCSLPVPIHGLAHLYIELADAPPSAFVPPLVP